MLVINRRFERWPENGAGRDYVAGDVHGCFRTLEEILRRERFNPDTDRLFAVGDLVNRGPNSAEVTDWLRAGRITRSVLGNHDATVLGSLMSVPSHPRTGWLGTLDRAGRTRLADALAELPLGIELATRHGPVGIVHAGIVNRDFDETRRRTGRGEQAVIGQVLVGGAHDAWRGTRGAPVAGVALLVTGHEPLRRADSDGYWHRIDTGAGLAHLNRLTLLEVTSHPPRRLTLPVLD